MADSDLIPILLAQAWQITLLIVVVAGINRWLSRKRPHLAHALWLVVLVKCVTPPLWSSPSGMFCWLQAPRVVEQEDFRFPVDAPAGSFVRLSDLVPDQTDVIERMEKSLSETDITLGESLSELGEYTIDEPPPVLATPTRSWSSVLLGTWLLASLLVIGVAVVRFLTCWRLLKKSPQRECPELNELLSDLAKRLRLRRRVRLIVTESRLGPAVIGLFRSTVLLPATIGVNHGTRTRMSPTNPVVVLAAGRPRRRRDLARSRVCRHGGRCEGLEATACRRANSIADRVCPAGAR